MYVLCVRPHHIDVKASFPNSFKNQYNKWIMPSECVLLDLVNLILMRKEQQASQKGNFRNLNSIRRLSFRPTEWQIPRFEL
jgi:hypothetical protein